MADLRVYGYIFADFTAGSAAVSDANWQALINAAKQETMSAAIISAVRAAHNDIQANKRSQNASFLRLYTLVGFEIDNADVDSLLAVLDAEAIVHNITGNVRVKIAGVLQAELRQAALGLGYTQNNADRLSFTLINDGIPSTFDRDVAIQQAQAYLAANAGIWYV